MVGNVGSLDRVIRIILGLALLALALVGGMSATWAWVSGIVGAVLLVTGLAGSCPLYGVCGISSASRPPTKV